MKIDKRWGEAMKELRKKRDLTIRQVCERTKGMPQEISEGYLSQLENAKRRPNDTVQAQLLQIYGVSRTEFSKLCDEQSELPEIKPIKVIPVVDMAKGTFDNLWNADDKMFNSSIITEQIGAGGIRDHRAFVLEVNRPDMADCGAKTGDYLIISPKVNISSGEDALILIHESKEILVRKVFFKEESLVRLVSEDPAKEERIIERSKTEIKIYFIDSTQRKQRKGKRR